jgi:hypothetical protein
MICENWSLCIQNILRMVLTKCIYKLTMISYRCLSTNSICNVSLVKLLNNPLLHALIVCMLQFDTKLFTLQLLPLKTNVYFLTIQQKDILHAKRTVGCKELNFMRVIVTLVMPYALSSKIRMNREKKWRPFYFILFRK